MAITTTWPVPLPADSTRTIVVDPVTNAETFTLLPVTPLGTTGTMSFDGAGDFVAATPPT